MDIKDFELKQISEKELAGYIKGKLVTLRILGHKILDDKNLVDIQEVLNKTENCSLKEWFNGIIESANFTDGTLKVDKILSKLEKFNEPKIVDQFGLSSTNSDGREIRMKC